MDEPVEQLQATSVTHCSTFCWLRQMDRQQSGCSNFNYFSLETESEPAGAASAGPNCRLYDLEPKNYERSNECQHYTVYHSCLFSKLISK